MESVPTNGIGGALARLRQHQTPQRRRRNDLIRSIEQAYYPNDRDTRLTAEIDDLIDRAIRHDDALAEGPHRNVGRLGEGALLAVLGHSGAGKTRLLTRQFHSRPEFEGYGVQGSGCVLVSVQAKAPFSLGEFARDLAKAAGADSDKTFKNRAAAFKFAMDQLRGRVLFVHIDEAQTFLESGDPMEIQAGRNALRSMAQDLTWPISIILSGIEKTAGLFRDFQIARRQSIMTLESITLASGTGILRRARDDYLKKSGLENACDEEVLLPRLIHGGMEQLGECLDLMQRAVMVALRAEATSLTLEHFGTAFHLKVNAPPDLNVFSLEVAYATVDVMSLYEQKRGENVRNATEAKPPEAPPPPPDQSTKRKKKKADDDYADKPPRDERNP